MDDGEHYDILVLLLALCGAVFLASGLTQWVFEKF
jgi:hypothetical protein